MQGFARHLKTHNAQLQMTIADFGSQSVNGSYRELFSHPQWKYVGIDMVAGPNVDIVLTDPYDWRQIPSASYDVVISGQTFEHVEYMWLSILEIERVLKPWGLVCLIAPSSGDEHRYPVDCWRFYPDGFRALARFAQLEVLMNTTDWNPRDYGDDSGRWKDSMLVAQKKRDVTSPELIQVRDALQAHVKKL
jgi:SAM-dependent methyltransferase